MAALVTVTFLPSGLDVAVEEGTLLADAARAAGVVLAIPCGGRGTCGGCAVRVVNGALGDADEIESAALGSVPKGVRLACRARVTGPVSVAPVRTQLMPMAEGRGRGGAAATSVVAGVDLGTTTVAAQLVDAVSGEAVARAGAANAQAAYGADVLSRITAALEGHGEGLREAGESSVVEAISRAASAGGVERGSIDRIVIAANTAMAALFLGADVSGLAVHPFAVPSLETEPEPSPAFREWMSENARVLLVPPMAGFVGGDALAAMIAGGLSDPETPQLLLDIGTNAEIVLSMPGRVVIGSAAAGTAFEGAGISCGGPAGPGAVDRVVLEGQKLRMSTIGDGPPRWLSGSGFVSAVATLRRAGHVAEDGLLHAQGVLESRFSRDDEGVAQFTLSDDGVPAIRLTQLDVRALQLAKAAVRVGVEIVLERAGVPAEEITRVAIAGAFGAALDPEDLRALGVIPPSLAHRAERIGNAALEGAAALALNPGLLDLAKEIVARAEHVNLATEPGFAAGFVSATAFRE